MDDWIADNFVIELVNVNKETPKPLTLNLTFSDKPSRPSQKLIDIQVYKTLNETKDKIKECNNWSKYSKLMNPYEKISKIVTKNKVSEQISRAYFKLYEILMFFDIKLSKERTLSLCEAPGGFIAALLACSKEIDWYAQSLYTGSALKIDPLVNVKKRWLTDGGLGDFTNGDGDLTKPETIEYISKTSPYSLITADGGFDVSINPNIQEQLSFKLIFCECICALKSQEEGSNSVFICKLFDTVTNPTFQLLNLLKRYYTNVYLIKPRTSRYSNSEKYVVCKGFTRPSDSELKDLLRVVKELRESEDFCKDLNIPEILDPAMLCSFNNKLSKHQTKYINLSLNVFMYNQQDIQEIEARQNRKAMAYLRAIGEVETSGGFDCKHFFKNSGLEIYENLHLNECNLCDRLFVIPSGGIL